MSQFLCGLVVGKSDVGGRHACRFDHDIVFARFRGWRCWISCAQASKLFAFGSPPCLRMHSVVCISIWSFEVLDAPPLRELPRTQVKKKWVVASEAIYLFEGNCKRGPFLCEGMTQRHLRDLFAFLQLCLLLKPAASQEMTAAERFRHEGSDELGICYVLSMVVASEIELFGGWTYGASAFEISEHSVGHMVVLLRRRLVGDFVCKVPQIEGCLLELEFAYRLLLGDVACKVAGCIAHGALSAGYHFADRVFPQAVRLAILIMCRSKQWHAKIWTCVRVVTNEGQESSHRARTPLALSTTEDTPECIATT